VTLRKKDERRKDARVAHAGRVRLAVGARTVWGEVRNLSISGLLVEIERGPLLRRGSELQVVFDVGEFEVATRAEVIRHQGRTGMGLRFLRLDAEEMAAIKGVTG
jgi:hypothetical protein